MKSPIYLGPRQTISVKSAEATATKPATFKDVDLVPGLPLAIDPKSDLFASLNAAGFVGEADKETSASSKNQGKSAPEDKE